MSIFSFRGLTLRTAQPGAHYSRIAKEWTEADPHHRDTTPYTFWFDQLPGVESYILEDHFGVVFFFRMNRTGRGEIELHIQFPPRRRETKDNADQRSRVMRGMIEGLEWIERILAARDIDRLFFVSKSPDLIRFCCKRLGFTQDGERLVKPIGGNNVRSD